MRPFFHIISLAALVWGLYCIDTVADASDPQLATILDGIEKRYTGTGFTAKFFQESMLKAMQISDTAEGQLTVKRPDKMRWEYTLPDIQTIISNGKTMWIYRPADNQVMVGKAPDYFASGKGAGFLSDIHQIRKSFSIEVVKSENEAYYRLKLVPVKKSADLAEVILSVNKKNFQIDQVITYNAYGDETHIILSHYQFNQSPANDLFTLDIPEGVDVVQIDQP